MKNSKFLKHYLSAFLSGLMVLTTIANPMTTIMANATVSPASSTVTDGGSKEAIFKHKHATPTGTYQKDVKVGTKTVSGYTSPDPCYHEPNTHTHTSSCEVHSLRYIEKAVNLNDRHTWDTSIGSSYDQAYFYYTNVYGNNPDVEKTFRQLLAADPDFKLTKGTAAYNNMLDTMQNFKGGYKFSGDGILDLTVKQYVQDLYQEQYGDEIDGGKRYDGCWHAKHLTTVNGQKYAVYSHYRETANTYTILYYDRYLEKFVGNKFGDELTRDQETIFSIPGLLTRPYYWVYNYDSSSGDRSPSSETYVSGYDCGSIEGTIYSNSCGTGEGTETARAKATASGKTFSYEVKPTKPSSSKLALKYTIVTKTPSGTSTTTVNNQDLDGIKTGSITCTDSGNYVITVKVTSYINDNSSYKNTKIDEDIATFTYKYTKPCSVTYHLGTGNMKDGATVPAKETNITAGTTHTPKTATSYTGYYFDGWYKNENCTGTKYTGGALNSDLDLYGKYVQWTVNFYEGSPVGTQKIATRTMIKGDELQQLDFDISNPKGYTPKGFYTAESGQGTRVYTGRGTYDNPSGGFLVDGTYTVNLYADYSANKYNVTYDYNLEGTPLQTDEMTYDQPAILSTPHVPDDGYFFLGWFEKLTDEVPWFNADRTYKNGNWDQTQDVRVYAKYVPKDFKLYYSLNKEEDVTAHMQETHYNEAYGLTAADKQARTTYKGYTFLGWYDTEDNTQIFDANGNNTDTGVWKYMRDIYAKATYEPNKYKINYYVENPEEESVNWLQDETTFDQPTTLSNQIKTYDGWTFEGWYEEDDTKLFNTDGTYVGTDTKWDLDRDVTVYAKFTPIKYKLNYNLNKEEAVTAHSKTIQFNSNYGLSNTDKQNRKEYKGYTFLGWYDDNGNLFFDKNGNNVNGSVWRYTHDVNASVKYEANKYKVYYNTKLEDPANKNIDVVFDDPYSLPAADVSAVPHVKGYTFDGWYMEDGTKIFNTDGSSVEDVYSYDHDIYVYVKYHPNKYTVHYNNTEVEDTVLDKLQEVVFDEEYDSIEPSPYKPGYVFDGHTLEDSDELVWANTGNVTNPIWIFATGRDGDHVNAYKNYSPKEFTVYIGPDFDNDDVLDSIEQTAKIKYDGTYGTLVFEVPDKINGYTFEGFKLLENNVWIADKDAKLASETWIYDDNKDWNTEEATKEFHIAKKWHANEYILRYNDWTVEDDELTSRTVVFDEAYDSINKQPVKTGYVGNGWTLTDINNEKQPVFKYTGEPTKDTFTFELGEENSVIDCFKDYSPKEFTVYLGPDFDDDGVLDTIEQTAKVKYDENCDSLVFEVPDEINGYTFDGFKLLENDVWVADENATLASETWIYDDGKDWNEENADKEFHIAKKWHRNKYELRYNDWTVEDDELTSRTVIFGEAYDPINKQPYKTGYVGDGWTLTDRNNIKQPVFNYTGEPTKDTFTFDLSASTEVVDCFKAYSPKEFTVYIGPDFDNDDVLDTIEQTAVVRYDETYGTLTFEVPDKINGYTFDGFKLIENDIWIADEKATLASDTWIWDDEKDWNEENIGKEFHIAKKWHANKYTLRYNDWTVEDDELTSRSVIFDEAYERINKQPYKTGYVGNGWTLTDINNEKQPVFKYTGEPTKDTFTFELGEDDTTVDCFKAYSPKEFTVYLGPDFDDDGVLDTIEQTAKVKYDENCDSLVFEVPDEINGYTFDGFKLLENDVWIADKDAKLASDTWIYDDGKDWNEEDATKEFHIAKKWHANKYTLRYNDWTVEDTELKSRTVVFDEPYDGVNKQPHKKGYSGEGWYFLDKNGEEQSVFLEPGDPTKATFTFNLGPENTVIDCYKKYAPNHYTVYYNTNEQEEPTRTVEVIYDDPYQLPEADVAIVPDKTGYTFDGWVEQGTTTLKFKTDGKPSGSPTYDIEGDLTVVVKYHPNTIKVNYNNTEVEDDNLDKHQTVVYDSPYNPIDISPYKIGYIFDGHYIGEIVNKIWDSKGKQVSPKYIYSAFADNAEVDAYKSYIPKVFDVQIGDDYDENDILDAVDFEDIAVYDNEYFDFPVPEKRRGLELDGYYLLGTDICLAKYDPSDDTLTKTSNIWIWDDGIDWNITDDYTGIFEVERRWTHLDVPVLVRTETDEKVTPGVGNKSDYVWTEKDRTETYDRAYDDETLPAKRGYDFMGYIVDPRDEELEKLDIWNAAAKSSEETFTWLPVGDNEKVIAVSVFKPMDIPVFVPADKYDPKTDIVTPNPIDVTYTYDDPYDPIPTIPEKEGFDYDGIVDKDGNPVWDKDGNPTQEVWQYLEEDVKDFIIKWTPKTYILVYPNKTDEQTITFGEAVPVLYTLTKKGHTFKGYSFDYFGTEIHGFNEKGEYGAPTWLYDMGPSGTKIPLTDLWDLNDYIIHVEPNAEGFNNYDVTVSFEKAYTKQTMPTKYGYFTKGYIEKLPEGSEKNYIWNADGTPSKENYPYDYDITAVSDWQAKTFYVHCGDQVIKVVFDEKVTEKANIPSKSDHTFNGWTYDGKTLFKDDGVCVKDIWDLDVGPDGTHIYCDPQFTHNPVKDDTITPPASNNNPAPPANDGGKKIQTDDMNNPVIYLVLITLFASAGAAVITVKKKKEEE